MSDILKSVHKTAKGLKEAGAIDKTTMRRFDTLCLTSIHDFTPEQVKKTKTRQPSFPACFRAISKRQR